MSKILAIAEQKDGALRRAAHETVTAARTLAESLGGETHALVIGGAGTESLAPELAKFGADTIHVVASDSMSEYAAEAYAATVADVVKAGGFHTVVFPASSNGRDLAPRVAARLDVPLASDATAIEVKDGTLMLNDAKVTKADIEASNGVIHVIDTVLMPPAGE